MRPPFRTEKKVSTIGAPNYKSPGQAG
ncbi:hypothetical protein RHRU231_890007 [Rhodococcus ruber]|uniref:Uncharacterized protein n=1 Tax=Rhodococcus ruber TaxID=1830 RepID=A0A098BT46_9NOCA|nr:hypothetical protein RHRU231_890007 [Rhodococcus ruber]